MKQKLTPWFSARLHRPSRVGVYQIKSHSVLFAPLWSLWDGKGWRYVNTSPEDAATEKRWSLRMLDRGEMWRGIAK